MEKCDFYRYFFLDVQYENYSYLFQIAAFIQCIDLAVRGKQEE